MQNIFIRTIDSPCDKLVLRANDGGLTDVAFADCCPFDAKDTPEENGVIRRARDELEAYFAGELKEFTVPLSMEGSDFQRNTWNALRTVPYGETASYRDIATRIGSPGAVRAVGNANARNPVMIIVPCHRVLPAAGGTGGYTGGQARKVFLIHLERRFMENRP